MHTHTFEAWLGCQIQGIFGLTSFMPKPFGYRSIGKDRLQMTSVQLACFTDKLKTLDPIRCFLQRRACLRSHTPCADQKGKQNSLEQCNMSTKQCKLKEKVKLKM